MKTEYDGIGIYALIDDDGKMYIGSSVNVKQRLIRHRQKMKDGTCNKKMQEALKQGKMFHCEIIEKIEYGNNLWYLWEREQYYIKKYNTIEEGYNVAYECRGITQDRLEPILKQEYKNIFCFFNETEDADILEHLDKQSNKQGYLKALIRQDIKRSK